MGDAHRIVPIILAGGRGTRLRPLTSETRAKPFLRIFGKYSLLQETIRRASKFGAPVLVCESRFKNKCIEHLDEIGVQPRCIVTEPMGRSTAIAIAQAAFLLREAGEGAASRMLVMPSDHHMPPDVFKGVPDVQGDELLILGAEPRGASTRYGYIRTNGQGRVTGFTEKPDKATARLYITQGGVYWNTGIFMMTPDAFFSRLERHAPDVYAAALQAFKGGTHDGLAFLPDTAGYGACPPVAVDYAVMEHVSDARLYPIRGRWDDIGCWPALVRVKLKSLLSF